MSETLDVNVMTRMIERLEGVAFCTRFDPSTGKIAWLYLGVSAAELYDMPRAEILADPKALLARVVAEDLPRLEAKIAACVQTGAPMDYLGRTRRRDGDIRWLETHATVEREADGTLFWCGQTFDVTERKQREEALAASEALYRRVVDSLPVGVMVANTAAELVIMNTTHQQMVGGLAQHADGDVSHAYGIFMADGVTPLPTENTGLVRGLRGETLEEEVVIRNPRIADDVRLRVFWRPLRDEGGQVFAAVGTALDITLQRRLETELRARNEALAASESAKANLIDRLRYAIDELSNPILEVWDDVLVMPIIGVVDSRRTADMVQRLLAEVTRTQASFVILDLTGVEVIDTKTADHLMKLMRKVEIVGSRCVLTGIRPAVAESLVDIGVDFGRIITLRNLKHGLREALRHARRGLDGTRSPALDEDPEAGAQGRRGSATRVGAKLP